MRNKRKSTEKAINVLKTNLHKAARVSEWAEVMGFEDPKVFSRHFLRHFKERPEKVLTRIRLMSIVLQLKENNSSHFNIAEKHSMPDGKALYNFVKRHTGFSPSQIKELDDEQLKHLWKIRGEKTGSKFV